MSLGKSKHYDENWYMHLMYSVHQAESMDDIKPGDVIVLHRGLYIHFAVVIHTDPQTYDITTIDFHANDGEDALSAGVVGERTFKLYDEEIWILQVPEEKSYSRDDVVARAWSRLGEDNYNLVSNNCEHFAMWCKTGDSKSKQVLAAGIAGFAAVGGLLLGATSLFKTLISDRRKEDEDRV